VVKVDARWVIVDLIGKGGRVRTVPMPSWTKSAIDSWIAAADIRDGLVFRAMNRGGRVIAASITPRAICQVVQRFGDRIGAPNLAPTISDARSQNSRTRVVRD